MNAPTRVFLARWGFSVLSLASWSATLEESGAEQAVPATTVEGSLLDLPSVYPDGSIRFHLAGEPLAEKRAWIPVPAGGQLRAAPILEDNFDADAKARWEDVLGTTAVADGKLVADSPRNDVILRGSQEQNVRVSVDGQAAAQMAILVRYQDVKNFVMAFYTPGPKLIGFHEAVDGNLGPWINQVSTAHFTGKSLHLSVEMMGERITATLNDENSHVARTGCAIHRITKPGSVGLYHDPSAPDAQRFDNFRLARLERGVPAGAVQVVVPKAAADDEHALWAAGRKVRVQGVETEFETSQGPLRGIKVAGPQDIIAVTPDAADESLFPVGLPNRRWLRFPAAGLDAPACGVIYRSGDRVTNGLPLGGIDTGCIDLETSGLLGYATIFNTHVPRRGPLNVPLLGLSVGGQTWLLCDPQPKDGFGEYQHSSSGRPYRLSREGHWVQATEPITPVPMDLNQGRLEQEGVRTAKEIHYWGHYPVADLEFETDAPIRVGLRAWAPFFPGAVTASMLPGAVFEVHLRNPTETQQQGTIACSFPGPLEKEAGAEKFQRNKVEGAVHGVEVTAPLASYVLGTIGEQRPRLGAGLNADGLAWAKIARELPSDDAGQAGSSAAIDFSLGPRESRTVRFVLAWHAPTWNAGGYNWSGAPHCFTHMYAKHYPSARQAARMLAENHESLLRRILAWQQVLYTEKTLPVWLRDSLVNNLHLITETGLWAQKAEPLPSWVCDEDGLFGMNECPRGCPQIECIPCSFYGNQPLVYFFPELALSTLRGYKGYQYPDGAAVWVFGGCTGNTPPIDFANPTKGYQWVTNGISLAAMVDRYYLCYGEEQKGFVAEFHPMIKSNMIYTVNLRPEYPVGDRIVAMPTGNQGTEWFEAPEPGWRGMTAHVGGLHLAQLRIAERMARLAGDEEFAKQCVEWLQAGSKSMEEKLWTGSYYLNYWEPESKSKSDLIFGYQLDGEWITDHHGLPSALPPERVRTVLATVQRCNVAVTKYGAVNYTNADGTRAQIQGYGTYSYFPPEALMLAMTYMYNGQQEFGLELARKTWHNIFCQQGYTWDMPNIMRGDVDTGERTFGNDYYQDMMLWSLPAAIAGQDFGAPAKPGGLVDRVRKAASGPVE